MVHRQNHPEEFKSDFGGNQGGQEPARPGFLLSQPSAIQTEQILRQVDYFQAFNAQRMNKTHGLDFIQCFSLADVVNILEVCIASQEDLEKGNISHTCYLIDLFALAEWIQKTLGDKELAVVIKSELGPKPSSNTIEEFMDILKNHLKPVFCLTKERLEQCRGI